MSLGEAFSKAATAVGEDASGEPALVSSWSKFATPRFAEDVVPIEVSPILYRQQFPISLRQKINHRPGRRIARGSGRAAGRNARCCSAGRRRAPGRVGVNRGCMMMVMSAMRSRGPLRLRRLRGRGILLKLRKCGLCSLKIARFERCTDGLEILRQRALLIR